ncbi:hypothetical protein TNCV_3045541 [Trichonephila clavipes]|nr:hypothetical protein TNCV_3045541 [Trichonephila clavipes]
MSFWRTPRAFSSAPHPTGATGENLGVGSLRRIIRGIFPRVPLRSQARSEIPPPLFSLGSPFNGLYGRQSCVLARTVESNQGGRFDGNESIADSFQSAAVSFKSTDTPFLVAFSLIHIFPEVPTRLERKTP